MFSALILILTSAICLFNRWQYNLEKSIASVLSISYVIALYFPYSSTTLATLSRALASSFTKYPEAIKPKSSTNDKNVTSGLDSATLSNTPLIYIRKNIGETGDPCGISVSISHFLLLCPSITSWIFQPVEKNCVHQTISPSIPSSVILSTCFVLETWSKAPFIFIKKAATSFFSAQHFWTLCIRDANASIAHYCFWTSIWLKQSLEKTSQNSDNISAITFSTTFLKQLRRLMT